MTEQQQWRPQESHPKAVVQSFCTRLSDLTRLGGNGETYSTVLELGVPNLGNHGPRRKGSESQEKTLRSDIAEQILANVRTCYALAHILHPDFTCADPFLALNTATCSPCFF